MDLVEPHLRVVLISAFDSVAHAAEFSRSSCSRLAKGVVEEAMGQLVVHFRQNRRCDPMHN